AARLDSLFYFRDLWTYAAYRHFNTIYTNRAPANLTRPRYHYPDDHQAPAPLATRYRPEAEKSCMGNFRLTIVQGRLLLVRLRERDCPALALQALISLPSAVHHCSLVLIVSQSPYYVEKLPESQRREYRRLRQRALVGLKKAGLAALLAGDRFS